ncbi:MAG: hypothetical protein H8E68_08970 [Kiritimatiellaeota bacterium]|nr:hypothetical protein [Kiritimatiellota bacterium]
MQNNSHRVINFTLIGLIYVGLILLLISKGQFLLSGLLALFPFAVSLVLNRERVFIYSLYASVALIGIPGIRLDSVAAGMLFQFAVVFVFAVNILMQNERAKRPDLCGWLLIIFLLNMLITASIRGFGLYRLGGNMIGGMTYIQILIGFLFFLYLRGQNFSPEKVEKLFLVMVGLSAVPLLAQMFLGMTPALMKLGDFFVFNKTRFYGSAGSLSGRYETAVNFSYLLICLGVILKAEKKWWGVLLPAVGVLLLLANGFRRYMVLSMFIFGVSTLLLSKRRVVTFLLLCGLGVGGLGFVYAIAPRLPPNIQRSVSFLPGIQVEAEALYDAEGSSEWRGGIFEYAKDAFPDYWLLGKGLLLSIEDTMFELAYRDRIGWADSFSVFNTHNYHSGIIELLMDLGVIGFSSFVLFCLISLRTVWRQIMRANNGTRLWRIMTVLWSVCVALLADYLLFRGEFKVFIATFLLFYGLMILAYNSHVQRIRSASPLAADLDVNYSTAPRHSRAGSSFRSAV